MEALHNCLILLKVSIKKSHFKCDINPGSTVVSESHIPRLPALLLPGLQHSHPQFFTHCLQVAQDFLFKGNFCPYWFCMAILIASRIFSSKSSRFEKSGSPSLHGATRRTRPSCSSTVLVCIQ